MTWLGGILIVASVVYIVYNVYAIVRDLKRRKAAKALAANKKDVPSEESGKE